MRPPKAILAVNGPIEDFGHFAGQLMHVVTYASMTRAIPADMPGFGSTGAPARGLVAVDPKGAMVRKIRGGDSERILIRTRFTFDPGIDPTPIVQAMIDYRGTTAAALTAMLDAGFARAVAAGLAAAAAKAAAMAEP